MTLVDTSVWIEHIQSGGLPRLAELVESRELLIHPAIIGEIALGNLGSRRAQIIASLRLQQSAPVPSDAEALELVDAHRLWGTGIGWIDVHLLASARVAPALLWTLDRKLAAAARKLGVAA